MLELEGNRLDTVDTRPRFQTITTNQTQDYVILAWECEESKHSSRLVSTEGAGDLH